MKVHKKCIKVQKRCRKVAHKNYYEGKIMEVLDIDVADQISRNCVDDFDIQGVLEIYGESANSYDGCIDFVGLDDFASFAGKEVSNVNGNIYPSKECSFFMTFAKEYACANCSENSQWIKGLRYWVPAVSDGFIENVDKNGKQFAIRNTACTSFLRWCDMFLHNKKMFGYDLINLPIAMFHNINVRDAMLISILDEDQEWYDDDSLAEFAWYPHTTETSRNLRHCLEAKFTQKNKKPDIKRAIAACKVLEVMTMVVKSIPELTVQVYALLAYISWWFKLGNVKYYADCALEIDKDCTMAKIVRGACENNLEPAWIDNYATPQEN